MAKEKTPEEKAAPTVKVRAKLDTHIDGKLLAEGQEATVTLKQYSALAARLTKLAACALLLFITGLLTASAQQYTTTAVIAGGTNNVSAATTNSVNEAVTLTKHDEVGVLLSFKMSTTCTGTVTFNFDESLDGTTYCSSPRHVVVLTANGTTAVNYVTNFTPNAVGYLRLHSVANTNAEYLTNLTFTVSTKPKRQG